MDQVFPIRVYGDGADTIGLNAFELLTMIAVAPQHSFTMKTRIVFLGPVNCFVSVQKCFQRTNPNGDNSFGHGKAVSQKHPVYFRT